MGVREICYDNAPSHSSLVIVSVIITVGIVEVDLIRAITRELLIPCDISELGREC
jgi:hypothetical protein